MTSIIAACKQGEGMVLRTVLLPVLVLLLLFTAASGHAARMSPFGPPDLRYVGAWVDVTHADDRIDIVVANGRVLMMHEGNQCASCRDSGRHFLASPITFIPDFIRVSGCDFLIDGHGELVNTGCATKVSDYGHRYRRIAAVS